MQRQRERARIPGVAELDPAKWPDHAALLEVNTVEGVVGACQMNTIEFHVWNARSDRLDVPDRMMFDLDPGARTTWPQVREAAQAVHEVLERLGLKSWLKTSGSRGLHLIVPLRRSADHQTIRTIALAIVRQAVQAAPRLLVARSGSSNRAGRVFVDYLRNGIGASAVAAYSARARPGLPVSMPIGWKQLADVADAGHWTTLTTVDYLAGRKRDPWAALASCRQALPAAARALVAG
ncbi:MAG: DNA polymerase domain-containing protein [Lautropia sp.]